MSSTILTDLNIIKSFIFLTIHSTHIWWIAFKSLFCLIHIVHWTFIKDTVKADIATEQSVQIHFVCVYSLFFSSSSVYSEGWQKYERNIVKCWHNLLNKCSTVQQYKTTANTRSLAIDREHIYSTPWPPVFHVRPRGEWVDNSNMSKHGLTRVAECHGSCGYIRVKK